MKSSHIPFHCLLPIVNFCQLLRDLNATIGLHLFAVQVTQINERLFGLKQVFWVLALQDERKLHFRLLARFDADTVHILEYWHDDFRVSCCPFHPMSFVVGACVPSRRAAVVCQHAQLDDGCLVVLWEGEGARARGREGRREGGRASYGFLIPL